MLMTKQLTALCCVLLLALRATEAQRTSACRLCGSASAFAQEKVVRANSDGGKPLTCGDLNSAGSRFAASDPVCGAEYRVYAEYCECAGTTISCPICPDGSKVPFPERALPTVEASASRQTCGDLEVDAALIPQETGSTTCTAHQILATWCGCPDVSSIMHGRQLRGCELCPGSSVGNPDTLVLSYYHTCGTLGSIIAPSFDPGSEECLRAQAAAADETINCCLESAGVETIQPSEPPSEAPVEPPTEAPVEPPTEAPVEPPTEAPVEPLTAAPAAPTEAPTGPPTLPPVKQRKTPRFDTAREYGGGGVYGGAGAGGANVNVPRYGSRRLRARA